MEKFKNLPIKNLISNASVDIMKEQILELLSTTQKLTNKNKSLLANIHSYQPHFSYDLYRTRKSHGFAWQVEKEIKLRQIDKLIDQQEFLSKKMQQVRMRKYFSQLDQQKISKLNQSQLKYQDMRNILSPLGNQSLSCVERIDQLNNALIKMKKKVDIEATTQKLSLRKDKSQNIFNSFIPSKKYWKMKYRIQELQLELKTIARENKRLHRVIKQKQQQIYIASQHEQRLEEVLRDSLKKLQNIHENLKLYQNSFEAQDSLPSRLSFNPEHQFCNVQQGLQIYILRLKKEYIKGRATNKKFNQIYAFLREESQNPHHQSPFPPEQSQIQPTQKTSLHFSQKTLAYIPIKAEIKHPHVIVQNQDLKTLTQISILRNCQSFPNITHSSSSQIQNIESINEKQNKAPGKQQEVNLKFKRCRKHKKYSPYFFAECFL